MPVHGFFTGDERSDMAYDLAKLYLQLRGEAYETPEAFTKAFLDARQEIAQSLPSRF